MNITFRIKIKFVTLANLGIILNLVEHDQDPKNIESAAGQLTTDYES